MNNDLILSTELEKALATMNQDDFLRIFQDIDPVMWIENNRMLKGKPFSFKGRDYLLQPYRDNYQDIIFYKGRQVEMSEFSMNWLLRKLHEHPYTAGLHTFPRANQCQKFSKQRLDSAIRDSDVINAWYEPKESEQLMRKFIKKTGDRLQPYNFYIMGGTWESRKDTVGDASRGLTIDFIVYDERQDHPDDVETVIGESASHSEYKQSLTLGTPKLPGTQFDMQWENSDKHFWHIKCEHCGYENPITMDNILDSSETDGNNLYYYGCPKCKQPINRLNGRWIATNPQKRPLYRGYHINQLMVPWITPDDIMKKFNSPTYPKRRFYNEVLGYAYGGDDVPITIQMMYNCADNSYKIAQSEGAIYVGVDWGASSYAVLENKTVLGHKLVDCLMVSDSDPREHPRKIAKMLKKYKGQIKKVVCDAGPDITRFYNLRDALKEEGVLCEVWACYYSAPPAKKVISWDEKERNVTVGRSEFIELIIDEVSDSFFVIPGEDKGLDRIEMLMDHFTNMSAERGRTGGGIDFIQYVATGPDHFMHAKLYADVASYNGASTPLGGNVKAFSHKSPDSNNNGRFPQFQKKRGISIRRR